MTDKNLLLRLWLCISPGHLILSTSAPTLVDGWLLIPRIKSKENNLGKQIFREFPADSINKTKNADFQMLLLTRFPRFPVTPETTTTDSWPRAVHHHQHFDRSVVRRLLSLSVASLSHGKLLLVNKMTSSRAEQSRLSRIRGMIKKRFKIIRTKSNWIFTARIEEGTRQGMRIYKWSDVVRGRRLNCHFFAPLLPILLLEPCLFIQAQFIHLPSSFSLSLKLHAIYLVNDQ